MNVVMLIGRLVADPELKYTPSGVAVTTFRIAVNRRFANKQTGEREADFIDVVAWRQSAEFAANYLSKGRLVAVQGSLQVRSWVQQDGTKRYKSEVVADQLQGLDKRPEGAAAPAAAAAPAEPSDAFAVGSEPAAGPEMDYDPFAEE
jgi:single-strand DNA-binding protein